MVGDFAVEASRAIKPYFFRAPCSEHIQPREFQLAAAEYALARDHCIIGDAPGVGKAQPLDALVRVSKGWTKIGDLKVGDGVCGYDGRSGRVVGIYDRGVMDIYEVMFNDGSKTRVSEDHLWAVGASSAKRFVAPTWLIAKKIKTDKIWIPLTAPVTIWRGRVKHPYLIGLLLGDGCLVQDVRMSSGDEEIVDYCRAVAKNYNTVLKKRGKYDYHFSCGKTGGQNDLLDFLRSLGMIGWKSPKKVIPNSYLYAGKNERLALLRGLMDSDGNIHKGQVSFTSTSEDLAYGVRELVQSLGGIARISYQKNKYLGYWRLSINITINPFKLFRKANQWKAFKKYKPRRIFKSITYIGKEKVRCIDVTCADRLYLTDDYIVTHNTGEALLVGNAIEARNTLVVCPASLRLNWDREIRMWSTIPGLRTYPVLKAKDGVGPHSHYTIISYDLLRNESIFNALMDQRWDHLILDEGHFLKDSKGNKRTKAICGWTDDGVYRPGIADVSGRITMATGTLMPNQPVEAYVPIRLLDWSAIDEMSLMEFRRHYYGYGSGFIRVHGKVKWSDRVLNVPRNLDDLQYRLRKHLMVRRLKEDVLHELPPKHWHVFPLAITSAMRQALKHPGWKQAEKLYEMDSHAFDKGVPVDGAISTARRLLGEAKAPAIVDYINDLLAEGINKIIVAAWHHSVLDFMREKLQHHGLVFMDGSTSATNKQKAVDMFQFDDKVKIILGQTQPLGMGWALTAAQDVVNAEPSWVPGASEQLLDRPHRIGQEGDYVLGHVPVVPGTMDERILGTAIEKDVNIYAALDKP